jgi:hypothetical protein
VAAFARFFDCDDEIVHKSQKRRGLCLLRNISYK